METWCHNPGKPVEPEGGWKPVLLAGPSPQQEAFRSMNLANLTRAELERRAALCRRMARAYKSSHIQCLQWKARAREAEQVIERYDAEQAKLGAWPGRPLK